MCGSIRAAIALVIAIGAVGRAFAQGGASASEPGPSLYALDSDG